MLPEVNSPPGLGFSKYLDEFFATTTMTSIHNKEWRSRKNVIVVEKKSSKYFENPRPDVELTCTRPMRTTL